MLTVVIPAHNEERTIYEVAKATRQRADEVIVVDGRLLWRKSHRGPG